MCIAHRIQKQAEFIVYDRISGWPDFNRGNSIKKTKNMFLHEMFNNLLIVTSFVCSSALFHVSFHYLNFWTLLLIHHIPIFVHHLQKHNVQSSTLINFCVNTAAHLAGIIFENCVRWILSKLPSLLTKNIYSSSICLYKTIIVSKPVHRILGVQNWLLLEKLRNKCLY